MTNIDNLNMENLESEVMDLTDEELESVVGGRTTVRPKHGSVNVYAKPSKHSGVVAVADTDDYLTCLGEAKKDKDNKTWLKVRVFGVTGWVRGDKVK